MLVSLPCCSVTVVITQVAHAQFGPPAWTVTYGNSTGKKYIKYDFFLGPILAHGVKCVVKVPLGRVQIHFCTFVVNAPGHGPKGLGLSPLINHWCILGVTRDKPIRALSPISFKTQEHCHFCHLPSNAFQE